MKRLFDPRLSMTALLLAGMGLLAGCKKKDEFLDKKPDTGLVVPSTLMDFQALLDNGQVFNLTPVLGEMSADNFYLIYSFWQTSLDLIEQNAYVWASNIYGGQATSDDWNIPYKQVFYANVILDGLPGVKTDTTNVTQWNALEGAALFSRAYAFFNIAQLFAPAYDSATANTDPGIPLRLHSDINAVSTRASMQETYAQIIKDLNQALPLLPPMLPQANRNRPSQPAAWAMLARVYLSMRAYTQAGLYADKALQAYHKLIIYDTLSSANTNLPIRSANNDETLYQSNFLTNVKPFIGVAFPSCVIDSNLYQSYDSNDLRRIVFYKTTMSGSPYIKGSYAGLVYPFSGLATDEIYLIRAECYARAGNIMGAINDLDTLLTYRYKKGTFSGVMTSSPEQAKAIVLQERRKELAFRGIRWTDLRRLNKEGANITLVRNQNGTIITLPSGDLRYTLPIPPDVIALGGIPQNPRP